ncbi:MAG: hypothetical protein GWO30_03795, partial [Gammaproteobacteria bacterium]|nr:hypothetical protein [Gammaproteobacteria bacterium]NIR27685.1 hypothetical protein [Gammaproteobacteria bacterium]NIY19593.1 hypothetical protein [Gammaproteobacteria bacterium]
MLWEALLPGAETGRTRGVNVGQCADSESECLYLATDSRATENSAGLHVVAVRLQTGELLWQFSSSYAATGGLYWSTPAVPVLMDLDQDRHNDTLVIGDLTGQLWALNLNDGNAYGGAPVYTVPANIEEPIGAAVSVYGNTVVFGTGGVAGSDEQQQYALYKVKISSEGGSLLWR